MYSKFLCALFLLASLHLLYSCRAEESLTSTPGSGDTLAVDTALVDTAAVDTLASDTVDSMSVEEEKMTPALLYLLSHSGEADVLPVIVRVHLSPTFNSEDVNSLYGKTHAYTKADIDTFMAEEKIRLEIIQQEYRDMWRQVGERTGLSFATLDSSDLSYASNEFLLNPAMIHALAKDSLVVMLDVQGEEPQPTMSVINTPDPGAQVGPAPYAQSRALPW